LKDHPNLGISVRDDGSRSTPSGSSPAAEQGFPRTGAAMAVDLAGRDGRAAGAESTMPARQPATSR
jgi:hypothetical protein